MAYRSHSLSDLQNNPQQIIDEAVKFHDPILITVDGVTAPVVLVDANDYATNMQALNEFMRIYKTEASIKPKAQTAND